MRVLLSFNPDDVALAEAFRASLFIASPDLEVFFSPCLFEGYQTLEFRDADALLLFVAWHGLTDQQMREYQAAVERTGTETKFGVIPVLAGGAQAPQSLPGHLKWIEAPVVTDRTILRQVAAALSQFHIGSEMVANTTDRRRSSRVGRLRRIFG